MFSWSSSGGSGPLDGLGNMTKTDILRGIITEKLSTAAREILAVVERTVADYEEEASGLRGQLARQRRQLEVLQPHVQLNRVSLVPDVEEKEEELSQQTGEEDYGNHGDGEDGAQASQRSVSTQKQKDKPRRDVEEASSLYPIISDETDDDDNWEQQVVEPIVCSVQRQEDLKERQEDLKERQEDLKERQEDLKERREDLKDPDLSLPSRSVSGQTPSDKNMPDRPRISDLDTHINIRVRFLEDSETKTLSNLIFQKTPVQDLRCPRDLKEAEFLNLLKSAFPQLVAEEKTIGMFRIDRSRRLQRIRVKTMTPEEIYRSFQPTKRPMIPLYLKLLTPEEEEQLEEGKDPQMTPSHDEPPSADPEVMKGCETRSHPSPVDLEDGHQGNSASHIPEQEAEDATEDAEHFSNDGDEAGTLDDGDDWEPCPEQKPKKKKKLPRTNVRKTETKTGKKDCQVCGVSYQLLGALKRHVWTHMDEPGGVCGICGDRFESVEALKGHLISHHECHACAYCGKSFASASSLNSHTPVHTGEGLFTCNVCSKSFTTSSRLRTHSMIHLEEKPQKCDICEKSFGTEIRLKVHRRVHTIREEYHCKVCGKTFNNRRSVALHKMIHTGERRHVCEICGKSFRLLKTMKNHMKTHTVRDRPFLCHICSKSFYSNQLLMKHMLIHTGETPFLCTVCGKSYNTASTLHRHRRIHTGERPHKCSECGRLFKMIAALKQHMKIHLGIKDFICGVCGKGCGRREYLKVHMRTHNGERPYKCTICDKGFTQSHCLKTHMKSHKAEEKPVLTPSTS